MIKLAAFADEISPELDEQIRVCKLNGVTHFELRGVSGKNVLDFDPGMRQEIRKKITAAGMGVACIGSPIGKVNIDEPWQPHFERFKIAVEMAEFFNARLLRLFSYYPPSDGNILEHRDEVIKRFRQKVQYVKDRPVTLVHENEARIYGEKGPQCLDLMRTIDSPKLRMAFDFANFVIAGDDPLNNWPTLKPYTVHIHIKDAVSATKKIVPAGEGDGHLAEILSDAARSGYDGFFSLEPHLAEAGQFRGFTGPALFKTAADALKKVCRENKIPLAQG